MNGVPSSVAP